MSRTPEVIVNKTAVFFRNVMIGSGIFSWLIALGAFQKEGHEGQGILFVLAGFGLFFIAAKIKTHYRKTFEVGGYK
ncbi:hypothetical protein [Nisaea nitritireducens]|uniref:hypothetical protein n=1 Tax=Nisaea nitritireducens TaxID=568392 RepID=UPI001868FF09|nr:hypothetical protein [Nisaea nitritireducens]